MHKVLVGAAVLAAFVLLIAGGQVRAETSPDTACHTPDTLLADLFAGQKVQAWRYTAAQATALASAADAASSGHFSADAASITVVYVPGDMTVTFVLYGADNCFFGQVLADPDSATQIFAAAGLVRPFGGIGA